MPPKELHLAQVRRNEAMAARLGLLRGEEDAALSVAARQWEAVARFYAALHWVEASLADRRQHAVDHRDRAARMQSVWSDSLEGRNAYTHLRDLAARARYDGWTPSDQALAEAAADVADVKRDIR